MRIKKGVAGYIQSKAQHSHYPLAVFDTNNEDGIDLLNGYEEPEESSVQSGLQLAIVKTTEHISDAVVRKVPTYRRS